MGRLPAHPSGCTLQQVRRAEFIARTNDLDAPDLERLDDGTALATMTYQEGGLEYIVCLSREASPRSLRTADKQMDGTWAVGSIVSGVQMAYVGSPRTEEQALMYVRTGILADPDEVYPPCERCGEPIDYCQGHGEIAEEMLG